MRMNIVEQIRVVWIEPFFSNWVNLQQYIYILMEGRNFGYDYFFGGGGVFWWKGACFGSSLQL